MSEEQRDMGRLEETSRQMIEGSEGVQPTDSVRPSAPGGTRTTEEARQQRSDMGEGEVAAEINRLADALTRALRATWQSDQRRQLQSDLNRGLRSLVDGVEQALTDFRESEPGQEVREQAERVVARVRSSKVAADLQKGLTEGLRSVAEEMQEFAERMEKQESTDPSPTAAQDIKVQDESQAREIPVVTDEEGGHPGSDIPDRPHV